MSYVWAYLSVTALMFTSLLLVFVILLQRGRGGGLAGAFGGAGGQSALGTKAGDVFTKITVVLAVFWVFLACVSIYTLRASTDISFDAAAGTGASSSFTADPERDGSERDGSGMDGSGIDDLGIDGPETDDIPSDKTGTGSAGTDDSVGSDPEVAAETSASDEDAANGDAASDSNP